MDQYGGHYEGVQYVPTEKMQKLFKMKFTEDQAINHQNELDLFYELAEDEYNNYLEEEDDKIEGERENNFKAQVPYDGIDWDEYQN